jgi:pimeloyl-ACP methyl ester carboxylesterase
MIKKNSAKFTSNPDHKIDKSVLTFFVVIIYLVSFGGCIFDDNNSFERGDVISSNLLNSYSIAEIKLLWSNFGLSVPIGLRFSVDAVRIVYQTIDVNGEMVEASGALILPVSEQSFPILSLQHGTESKRNLVASVSPLNSVEGIAGLYMSSLGYLVGLPDYLGFGVSTTIHPYCHDRGNTTVVVDFIRAIKNYCNDRGILYDPKLFLAGYSEGGYITLAVQKDIEQNYADEFSITAVAPMAGPYDLYGTIRSVFQKKNYANMGYIGYLFTAYDDIYQWNRLNDIFKSPYGDMMRDLFSGSYTWGEIIARLPGTFSALMKSTFVANFLNGNEPEVVTAFKENTLLNWAPRARVRFYHGDADQVVPYQNAKTAVTNLTNHGGTNVSLVTIKGGTHETAAAPCFIGMILWFDQFDCP